MGLERLKVLINSSTPIVVMETVEEVRAVHMVRIACADLNLATFEWTIASGLARSGISSAEPQFEEALPAGAYTTTRRSDFRTAFQSDLQQSGPCPDVGESGSRLD